MLSLELSLELSELGTALQDRLLKFIECLK